jgi:hypothetical protein
VVYANTISRTEIGITPDCGKIMPHVSGTGSQSLKRISGANYAQRAADYLTGLQPAEQSATA